MITINDELVNTVITNAQCYFVHDLENLYRQIYKYGRYDNLESSSEVIDSVLKDIGSLLEDYREKESTQNTYVEGLITGLMVRGGKDDK